MARFRPDPESIRRVQANVQALAERKQKQLALSLGVWADDTVAEVQQQVLQVGALDQGILHAATARIDVTRLGTRIRVTVYNPLEYATVVEFGRRPRQGNYPPLLPIVGWAARKGIITALPRNISFGGQWEKAWSASLAIFRRILKRSGGPKKPSAKPLDPIIRDMLIIRFIAKKIFERGIEGRHPFSTAFDRRARTFRQDVAAVVRLLRDN